MKPSLRHVLHILVLGSVLSILIPTSARATPPRSLLATTFPTYQMLRQLTSGIPGVRAELMLPAGTGCPHEYALTPSDMNKLARADALVINGLGLEDFLGPALKSVSPDIPVLDASGGLQDLLPDQEAGQAGNEQDRHGKVNPHLFASPRRVAAMTLNLGAQLAGLDPEHAARYRGNAQAYAARMNALADEFSELGKRLKNNRIVTQHGVFDYLAKDMGLDVVAVLQAHEDQQPSAADMLRLVREMRGKKVGAVFTEPQYPDKAARALARETGVATARLDPVAGGPDNAPADYYESVMRENLRTLERTLGTR